AMPDTGISAGFDEAAVTVRLPAGVSASPTVNGTAPVLVFSGVLRSVTSEIVGAVFGGGGGGDAGTVLVRVKVAGDATPAAVAVTARDPAVLRTTPANVCRPASAAVNV